VFKRGSRKLSIRQGKFLLAQALSGMPCLRSRFPIINTVQSIVEANVAQTLTEQQSLSMTADNAAFAKKLSNPVPLTVQRSVALIAMENATLLGSTGAVFDEDRGTLMRSRGGSPIVTPNDVRLVATKRVHKPPGNYFNMLEYHRGHRHYYHFIFDRLPKLYYLLNHFDVGREPIVVLTNTDLPGFQRDTYEFIARQFSNVRFEAVPTNERWNVDCLYYVDNFQSVPRTLASTSYLAFIRSLVVNGYGLGAPHRTRRLYVSRSDAKLRRISNECDLLPILARRGFEVVLPGRLSFRDQIALFMSAEVVIGPHGAGLTNGLFARNRSRVLELFPANHLREHYFLLTIAMGQSYRALIGGVGDRNECFAVNAAELEGALDECLAS